jgi:glucose-1-phosphate thymidylyltransferase
MKGLILAGGLATRLRPLSHTGPKQLIPIANKPVLHYIVEDLRDAGIKEIGIIVGYTDERVQFIKDSLGDGSKWGVKITYIRQDAPRGLAHACFISKDFMDGEDFVMYLGDNMLNHGISKFVQKFRKSDADATILLTEVDNPSKYGVAIVDKKGEIIDVEEKPEKPKSNLAIIGVYMFRKCVFDAITKVKPGKNG